MRVPSWKKKAVAVLPILYEKQPEGSVASGKKNRCLRIAETESSSDGEEGNAGRATAREYETAPRRRKCRDGGGGQTVPGVVRFSDVTVRKYPYVLGDNPGGKTNGPPVSIGWHHFSSRTLSVDEYEDSKKSRSSRQRSNGRGRRPVCMSTGKRLKLLQRGGYSFEEILVASEAVRADRERRCQAAFDRRIGGHEHVRSAKEAATRWVTSHLRHFGRRRDECRGERLLNSSYRPPCQSSTPHVLDVAFTGGVVEV